MRVGDATGVYGTHVMCRVGCANIEEHKGPGLER